MSKPLYSWESHELNFEPRIWDFLGFLADELYEGNRSKAVNSIILFSAIHFYNQVAEGKRPTHWLTAPAVKDPEQLEDILRMIDRIKTTGKAEEMGEWWRHELEDLQNRDKPGPDSGKPAL